MLRQQILLTNLNERPKVKDSQMLGMKSKLFLFYRGQNRNSLILQGPKEVLTLFNIAFTLVVNFFKIICIVFRI